MKLKDLFERWGLDKIKVKTPIFEAEFSPNDRDKNAAWELYVELLTRIATQPLPNEHGIEKTALESIYSLFPTTREVLRRNGRDSVNFTRVAVIVLNQVIRPFTAKWHKLSAAGAFEDKEQCDVFREELKALQRDLVNYTRLLADLADVEDLTEIEAM